MWEGEAMAREPGFCSWVLLDPRGSGENRRVAVVMVKTVARSLIEMACV